VADAQADADEGGATDASAPSDAGAAPDTAVVADAQAGTDDGGATAVCSGTCYYVSPTGSDSNAGTSDAPFLSIQRAADVVNPGETVIVEDGVYTSSNSNMVVVSRGGTSGAWVTFISQHPWGAKLDGQNASRSAAFALYASYVRVQNFEIYGIANGAPGGATAFDIENSSGFVNIVGNNIHGIGKICTDSAYGQDAIFTAVHDVTIERNVIHDVGRFAPGENGCTNSLPYYMNHDHGIYIDTDPGQGYNSYNVVVQNNVFYNNARGWSIQIYPGTVDHLVIVNNTFAFPNPYRAGQILVGTNTTNSFIGNNLFYQPNIAAIDFDSDTGSQSDSLTVAYNLSTAGIDNYASPASGVTLSNNLANVASTPLMVDPTNFDFRLSSGSPAIGAGTATNAPGTDYNGFPRPNPPSIGAYE
jgi:hypothetical protein